jgi:hypothetical protein
MHARPIDLTPTASAGRAQTRPRRLRLALAWATAALLAAGCSLPLQSARMALPGALETAAPLPFEGLGGGRNGRFQLEGQGIVFRRMGDALAVFDRLRLDRVSVAFETEGSRANGGPPAGGRCYGRAAGVTAGLVDSALSPLALSCRFTGVASGELELREQRLAGAGTRLSREGQARFGTTVIDIRSEHALVGSPLPLSQPAGYRLMIDGRDVAALELTDGRPVLRRAEGLDAPTRHAITQVALALGLLFEPAVTLG